MSTSFKQLFLHADGDSFFVACEIATNPEYKGKPVVVGEDRGIAVAMSYEAKKLGVTRGMPVFRIKREFPKVIILPHHFSVYQKISKGVNDILLSYFEHVEKYSIDESFAKVKLSDITFAGNEQTLVQAIKDEIYTTLGVTYSIGLARTKSLAKTASKLNKPNGMALLLDEASEEQALKHTLIDDIWGIGRQTAPRLRMMGLKTAYDFIHCPSADIQKYFSEPLYALQQELSGIPTYGFNSDVDPRDQKSIQSTATFKPSSNDRKIIFAELSENIEHACEHARKLGLMTNSISFFVKNTKFNIRHSGEIRLGCFTNNPTDVLKEVELVSKNVLREDELIRSTGITLHNLRRIEDVPQDLFGIQKKVISKNHVEEVGDIIRGKFGHNALKRASSLKSHRKERGNSFPKTD